MLKKISDKFQYFLFFYNVLRYRMLVSIFLGIIVGILDGLGLAMFIPLIQTAANVGDNQTVTNKGEGLLVIFDYLDIPITLATVLLGMLFFFTFKAVFAFAEYNLRVNNQQYFMKKIRNDNAELLSNLSYLVFVKEDIGRIQNIFTTEVERINQASRFYFLAMQASVLVFVYLSLAYVTNPKFAIFLSIGGVIINFFFKKIYSKTKDYSKLVSSQNSVFQGSVIQLVHYFKYLKASGLITKFTNRLKEDVEKIEKTNKKMGLLMSITQSLREPLVIFVLVVVIYIQLTVFKESLGIIILSLMFFYRALSSLMAMQNNTNIFISVSGSLINNKEFAAHLSQKVDDYVGSKDFKFENRLELKNISLTIDQKKILDGITLSIQKNETIALVGESGSGKTTLINIISGIIKPTEGTIHIDDSNFNNIEMIKWQKSLGYITQEPVIFTDTIFNNITFFSEPNEENKKRFNDVLKMASLTTFIDSLPEKENTLMGNNGINLSGGQKQRISIARELYKEAALILMDEATSALDSETEKQIQESTEMLQGNSTLIIIAHRLSTIKHADRIVVLDGGKILAIGSFNELLETSEKFNKMVQLQEF
ncbi:ABC transporter ATP-binding protein/permease [Flavobacterium sp. AS60]|uniref:ABC transporter ATP-binding protein n=1 Tax=Flavobacterium anseongense TaxID=2910677 RepID=UPI001F21D4D3|nr:ABC transporter ATP-binding protein [Flavobacterium sp. AS60]MCF6129884.1 ABC transporter ATP-binding protein/permease [Flavobacterium sp. AS60]